MNLSRHTRTLARLVLAWFALSIAVAAASPLIKPQSTELVCSGTGGVMLIVHADEGVQEMGASHLDCPLCLLGGAPPPTPAVPRPASMCPLGHAVQSIPAARIAAATAAPLPARGPPSPA